MAKKRFNVTPLNGPRDCRGLYNWGSGRMAIPDLDESFSTSDEYADEIRRLQGNVMPTNELPFGVSIRSASGAGCFGREPKI